MDWLDGSGWKRRLWIPDGTARFGEVARLVWRGSSGVGTGALAVLEGCRSQIDP